MAKTKIQYLAVSRSLFVPAATIAVFSSFSQPLPPKSAIAVQTANAVNTPVVQASIIAPFTRFSEPARAKPFTPQPWLNRPFVPEFIPPPFAQFGQPTKPKDVPAGFNNVPLPAFTQPYIFGSFSQPQFNRVMVDETPSVFLEVQPPPPPPFTGFARFTDGWRAKPAINHLFSEFRPTPFVVPADTHDIVFVDHRKKRKKVRDFVKDELEIKRKRREAIELAVYGPIVEYSLPDMVLPEKPKAPISTGTLGQIIAARQIEERNQRRAKDDQDDEDDFENLLKDIL